MLQKDAYENNSALSRMLYNDLKRMLMKIILPFPECYTMISKECL